MYLNRQDVTVFKMSDRANRVIKVKDNFDTSEENVSQKTQLSPTITETELLTEQPSIINGKNVFWLLSIPILFVIMGFIIKKAFQKINNNYSERQQVILFYFSKNKFDFLKKHSKIACRNCYFFNKNPYLKCALHPDKVLKKEAIDCLDYQSKKRSKNNKYR